MPTYRAKGPDGKSYKFSGPDGLDAATAQFLLRDYLSIPSAPEPSEPEPEPPPPGETGFIPSVMRGGRGLYSLATDVLPAMAGKAVGADDYAKRQMQEAADYQAETQKKYPAEVASYKDINSVGSALTYIKESIGEAIPTLVPSLFTGGATAILGRAGVIAAGNAALQVGERKAAESLAAAMAVGPLTQAAVELAKKEAIEESVKAATRIMATKSATNTAAGAFAGSAVQNIPDVYQNIYEETGKQDIGAALAFGGFNAALDAIVPFNILRKFKLTGVQPEEIAAAWYKRAGKGALEGFITEGGTEALQEVSSVAAERLVAQHGDVFTPENFERFINAGLKGALGGSAITAAANVASGKGPEAAPTPADPNAVVPSADPNVIDPSANSSVIPDVAPGATFEDVYGGEPPEVAAAKEKAKTDLEEAQARVEAAKLLTNLDEKKAEMAIWQPKLRAAFKEAIALGLIEDPIVEPTATTAELAATQTLLALGFTVDELRNALSRVELVNRMKAGETILDIKQSLAPAAAPVAAPTVTDPVADAIAAPVAAPTVTDPVADAIAAPVAAPTVTDPVANAIAAARTAKLDNDAVAAGDLAPEHLRTEAEWEQQRMEHFNALKAEHEAAIAANKEIQAKKDAEWQQSATGDAKWDKLNDDLRKSAQTPTQGTKDTIEESQAEARQILTPGQNAIGAMFDITHKNLENTVDEIEVLEGEKAALEERLKTEKDNAKVEATETRLEEIDTALNQAIQRSAASALGTWAKIDDAVASLVLEQLPTDKRISKEDMTRAYMKAAEFKSSMDALKKKLVEKTKEDGSVVDSEVAAPLSKEELAAAAQYVLNKDAYGKNMPMWHEIPAPLRKTFQEQLDLHTPKSGEKGIVGRRYRTKADPTAAFKALADFVETRRKAKQERDLYNESIQEREAEDTIKRHSAFTAAINQYEHAKKDLWENEFESASDSDVTLPKTPDGAIDLNKMTDEHVSALADETKRLTEEALAKREEKNKRRWATETSGRIGDASVPLPILEAIKKGRTAYILNSYLKLDATWGGKGDFNALIARLIAPLVLDTKIKLVNEVLPGGARAQYHADTDTVVVGKEGIFASDLLHEYVHAALVRVIHDYMKNKGRGLTEIQKNAVLHLDSLMDKTSDALAKIYPNAYVNLHEFVTYAMSDPKFQIALRSIPMTHESMDMEAAKLTARTKDASVKGSKSAWDAFIKGAYGVLNAIKKITFDIFAHPDLLSEVPKAEQTALYSALDAFERIITVPPGKLNLAPMNVTTLQAGPQPSPQIQKDLDEVRMKKKGLELSAWKLVSTKRGWNTIVKHLQNSTRLLGQRFSEAGMRGELTSIGAFQDNNVGYWQEQAVSRGMSTYNMEVLSAEERVTAAAAAYAKHANISIDEAMARLQLVLTAFHEPERRTTHFAYTVPLNKVKKNLMFLGKKVTAEELRDAIKTQLSDKRSIGANRANLLRAELDRVVGLQRDPSHPSGYKLDANGYPEVVYQKDYHDIPANATPASTKKLLTVSDSKYNVITNDSGTRDPDTNARVMRELYAGNEQQIDAVRAAIKDLIKITRDLNKQAGYWSQPLENVAAFYGWKDYVPFKGRKGYRTSDPDLDFDGKRIAGDFQNDQSPMSGRSSHAENPVLQILADGVTAAMNVGNKELLQAIKHATKKNGLLNGTVTLNAMTFEDRYVKGVDHSKHHGAGMIWVYEPDGSITVVNLTGDMEAAEAIRRLNRESSPLVELANKITSGVGQVHTRFNPAFVLKNFVTDALTNTWMMGMDFGPKIGLQMARQTAADMVDSNGLVKTWTYAKAFTTGNKSEMLRLANSDSYYKDLHDYVMAGGKVAYRDAVAARGALEKLVSKVQQINTVTSIDGAVQVIDNIHDMFELANRVSAFRTVRKHYLKENLKKGMFKTEAEIDANLRAEGYAKGLANFEQVGLRGKSFGAWFMFWRPAITGAVRAFDSIAPIAFSESKFRKEQREKLQWSMGDVFAKADIDKRIDKAVAVMKDKQKNAAYTSLALGGMGMGIYMLAYMLADDDDQGRNRVLADDADRWSKYMRFHIPGTKKIIQIPWGFGHGAIAASGAQMAAALIGNQNFGDAVVNSVLNIAESYGPVQVPRIDPKANSMFFALDMFTPSVLRPPLEYVVNMNSLGQAIYNNRQSKYGDAYSGGRNIPELYKTVARSVFNATEGAIDPSPNSMYFWANNYIDGAARIATAGYDIMATLGGAQDLDVKTAIPLVSSFIGSKSNIDAKDFSNVERRIKEMERRINTLQNQPELFDNWIKTHEKEYALVQVYNQTVNGLVKTLRRENNMTESDPTLTPVERKARLEVTDAFLNAEKRQLLLLYEDISGVKP